MKQHISSSKLYRLLYPRQVILISCMDPETGASNITPIAWATPLSAKPPLIGISIAPNRYSYELIEKSKEFAVNIPTVELQEKVVKCGSTSGRSANKFREFSLTPHPAAKIRAPLIGECIAHLECRLVDKIKTGDHVLLIGEVVWASAEEGVFENERMNTKKMKLLYQASGEEYTTI